MTKPYPFTPEQEAWLRDLETTTEPQTKGKLHRLIEDENTPAGYCCLGRACVALNVPEEYAGEMGIFGDNAEDAHLPRNVWKKLHLRNSGGALKDRYGRWFTLTDLNDEMNLNFKDIAAYIRGNPWNVFTNHEEDAS